MAITDPNAIRFANTRTRPTADRIAQLYYFVNTVTNEFTALELDSVFLKDQDPIKDGAETDGRPVIVGTDVNNLITLAFEIKALLEDNDKQKLNQVLRIAVNVNP